jgi:adenine-specific DNA-methyltransferase
MRDLLSPSGSIWVHLDDTEVHRMRCLLDEVFGAQNFVATVIWEKTDSPRMDARRFSSAHDSVLVYARNEEWSPNKKENTSGEADFRFTDTDGRKYSRRELRKWGSNSLRSDRPRLWYPLTAPNGTEVWPVRPDGKEGCWRWQKEKVLSEADRIEWVERSGGLEPYVKTFQDAGKKPIPPKTLWSIGLVGGNPKATEEVKALFPGVRPFSTPKPEALLAEVISLSSNPGDIVLDIFAGSGTTAAVAQKMSRRWVTSEISEATATTFTQPRLSKVVDGSDDGGVSAAVDWQGGGGFRTVSVAPSMYETTPLGVVLTENATNGRFARAVAGQLGFEFEKDTAPFCGRRGRMRLAVLDGAVGIEEVRELVALLDERDRVTVVAKSILPGVGEFLSELSKGSRVKKAPRDLLLPKGSVRKSRKLQDRVTP